MSSVQKMLREKVEDDAYEILEHRPMVPLYVAGQVRAFIGVGVLQRPSVKADDHIYGQINVSARRLDSK